MENEFSAEYFHDALNVFVHVHGSRFADEQYVALGSPGPSGAIAASA